MNKKVSIISVAMLLLTLTSVTSCDRGNQDISINKEKTQLYVGVYEGGLKSGSLYKIAGEFEIMILLLKQHPLMNLVKHFMI